MNDPLMWMNEYEIERAKQDYRSHHSLGPATQTLHNLMVCTNENSDGWPYWTKPARAAARLMEIITKHDDHSDVLASDVRRAYVPIKAFLTRNKLTDKCTIVEPA